MNVKFSQVENAFKPSKEIDNATEFAGRSAAVAQAYSALFSAGSNIAIIGNRGIGKSSLARQISQISQGNNELPEKLGLSADEKVDFLTIYHACGNSTETVTELLTKIITSDVGLRDWIYDIPSLKKFATTLDGKLKFGIGSIGGKGQEDVTETPVVTTHDIETAFQNITRGIIESGISRHGILIIVDEFDQIKDPTGFASLLKAMATNVPKIKFCIVGVAQDLQLLMKEHESADRFFAGSIISLPPMNAQELEDIIKNAEITIDNAITFDAGARRLLIDLAQGHPYMVHLLGKYALKQAFGGKISKITSEQIAETLKRIAESGVDPILENRYRKAITHSAPREIVLKVMAEHQGASGEILTTEAYKTAIERGVENPSQYVGQLVIEEYGAEIAKIRERYYRFKDSLFHAYVKAHPTVLKLEATAEGSNGA